MSCSVVTRGGAPAPWSHRVWCQECRSAAGADSAVALGMTCLRVAPAPSEGLADVLRALGLEGVGGLARFRARRRLRAAWWAMLAAVACLAACGVYWLRYIDREPVLGIGSAPMPANNGYPVLRTASALVVGSEDICRALVGAAKPRTPERLAALAGKPFYGFYTGDDRADLVARNEAALTETRKALRLPYMAPASRAFGPVVSPDENQVTLARLLVLEAQVRKMHGDYAGAMGSCLDAIELGRRVQHGSGTLGKRTGIACEALGREEARRLLACLSAPEALDATRRLTRLRAEHVSVDAALEEEKRAGIRGLDDQMRRPGWRFDAEMWTSGNRRPSTLDAAQTYLALLPYSKTQIIDTYRAAMDRNVAVARLSYPEQMRQFTHFPVLGRVESVLCVTYRGPSAADAENERQTGVLQVLLALRACQAETGRYPRTLRELVPRYLEDAPPDPVSGAAELSYRGADDTFALLDLGPAALARPDGAQWLAPIGTGADARR